MKFLIVTGLSGSGKSQAANALEDIGYYCIDNMPASLILQFAEIYTNSPGKSADVAFIIDARGETEFETLSSSIGALRKQFTCEIIFLTCSDEVLTNRYKESRRLHPFALKNGSLLEAIRAERKLLESVENRADYVIDTSSLTSAKLREKITSIACGKSHGDILINCMSFGFKYGIASESDIVFDVRCFTNPYYVDELKNKTGLDREVFDYVFDSKDVNVFCEKVFSMIDFLIPLYVEEGKTQLTVSFGCTGGKHRSVAICEALAEHLKDNGANVVCVHRDIDKK
ncbi:MAG: RNase adapter RapZ [Clostridia bacterium]|nr:RNase adapter RapZ [Clostridia bacterium]